ncbi:MAG: transporter substrate-binding domain-containing protein [Ruminococcaceae bacterium]|nr:transporter substrate-binding domain-containing protein [Oscillospiraceae bacterium]
MKKIVSLILALTIMVCGAVALTSCGAQDTKLGIQSGTTAEAYAKVLKGVEVVSFDTFALAAEGMKNGSADYVVVDKTTANAICKEISGLKIVDIALSSEYYGIAVDKTQTGLKESIDSILESKAAEIDAIKAKYMNGEEASYVGIESATKDTSKAAEQLVVATNAEFAPWEYKEGNKYYGIDMEIAKLIADELGLELVIDDMKFEMVVGAVGNHGVDIGMSGITITAERAEVVNFSTPYYTESIVVVCKADDKTFDSAGTVVDLLTAICYPGDAE